MKFVDEYDEVIDHTAVEYQEQLDAEKYIPADATVLELGARYGTVSCVINKKLKDPTKQVSVEPFLPVIPALKKNREYNDCQFHIWDGFISRKPLQLVNLSTPYAEFAVPTTTDTSKRATLEELEKKYKLKFDCLVADCEGCIESFLDENPVLLKQLRLILMEQDQPTRCDYSKIFNLLNKNGFKCIKTGFHSVWTKSTE